MPRSVKASFRPCVLTLKVEQLTVSHEIDARERHHEKYSRLPP
jgi:hypothetical protein